MTSSPTAILLLKGNAEQEVLQQAAVHASSVHSVSEITTELAEKVRSAIRDEGARSPIFKTEQRAFPARFLSLVPVLD